MTVRDGKHQYSTFSLYVWTIKYSTKLYESNCCALPYSYYTQFIIQEIIDTEFVSRHTKIADILRCYYIITMVERQIDRSTDCVKFPLHLSCVRVRVLTPLLFSSNLLIHSFNSIQLNCSFVSNECSQWSHVM